MAAKPGPDAASVHSIEGQDLHKPRLTTGNAISDYSAAYVQARPLSQVPRVLIPSAERSSGHGAKWTCTSCPSRSCSTSPRTLIGVHVDSRASLSLMNFSANIGNAKVLGLSADLHLSNGQYNWALSIFFIGEMRRLFRHVLIEMKTNRLRCVRDTVEHHPQEASSQPVHPHVNREELRIRFQNPVHGDVGHLGPYLRTVLDNPLSRCLAHHPVLPGTCRGRLSAWARFLGCVTLAQRSQFLPKLICAAKVGSWYPRHLQGRRFAVLYSSVSLTGAFGGLLATAIHSLNGKHGIAGWRCVSLTFYDMER
jgi:hypothetical protein